MSLSLVQTYRADVSVGTISRGDSQPHGRTYTVQGGRMLMTMSILSHVAFIGQWFYKHSCTLLCTCSCKMGNWLNPNLSQTQAHPFKYTYRNNMQLSEQEKWDCVSVCLFLYPCIKATWMYTPGCAWRSMQPAACQQTAFHAPAWNTCASQVAEDSPSHGCMD